MITDYAIWAREERHRLADECLERYPGKAALIERYRHSRFGRGLLASLLLGRDRALKLVERNGSSKRYTYPLHLSKK